MYKKKGFTLIELLVVIAIIALLLAIIVPALSKAKIYAEEIICKSNLHQYHLATEMYTGDNKDRYPNPYTSLYTGDGAANLQGEEQRYCRWHNPLYSLQAHPEYAGPYWPYLATTKVNCCPSFSKLAPRYGSSHFANCIGGPFEVNFGYSMNGLFNRMVSGTFSPVGKTEVRSPSGTFLWAEENMWTMSSKTGVVLSRYVLNDNGLFADGRDAFASFHKISAAKLSMQQSGQRYDGVGMSNVLLVDGSSRYIPIADENGDAESPRWAGTLR